MTGNLGGMTSTLETEAITAVCIVGDCFDVEMDGDWVPVRIEMDDDWYLVGVPKIRLDGLTVRADWYE